MRSDSDRRRSPHGAGAQSGSTLLEVMIALAIMASTYVALLEAQITTIRNSTFGKQITVAAFLAQTKIEETEELLLKEGFPLEDKAEEESFEKLGYPNFKYKLEINKIDLPLGAAVEQILTSMGGGSGSEADKKDGKTGDLTQKLSSQLAGLGGGQGLSDLVKNMPSLGGGAGSPLSMLANPAMLKGSMDMLSQMLEQSIRLVKVTVIFGEDEADRMSLTTHVVTVPQAPGTGGVVPPGMPPPSPGGSR